MRRLPGKEWCDAVQVRAAADALQESVRAQQQQKEERKEAIRSKFMATAVRRSVRSGAAATTARLAAMGSDEAASSGSTGGEGVEASAGSSSGTMPLKRKRRKLSKDCNDSDATDGEFDPADSGMEDNAATSGSDSDAACSEEGEVEEVARQPLTKRSIASRRRAAKLESAGKSRLADVQKNLQDEEVDLGSLSGSEDENVALQQALALSLADVNQPPSASRSACAAGTSAKHAAEQNQPEVKTQAPQAGKGPRPSLQKTGKPKKPATKKRAALVSEPCSADELVKLYAAFEGTDSGHITADDLIRVRTLPTM